MLGVSRNNLTNKYRNLIGKFVYSDNLNGRIFLNEFPDNSSLTVEGCIEMCHSQNFTLAGTEWSVQCFCGNDLIGGAIQVPESECNMGCGGNTTYVIFSSKILTMETLFTLGKLAVGQAAFLCTHRRATLLPTLFPLSRIPAFPDNGSIKVA